jgi:hypothetical protein
MDDSAFETRVHNMKMEATYLSLEIGRLLNHTIPSKSVMTSLLSSYMPWWLRRRHAKVEWTEVHWQWQHTNKNNRKGPRWQIINSLYIERGRGHNHVLALWVHARHHRCSSTLFGCSLFGYFLEVLTPRRHRRSKPIAVGCLIDYRFAINSELICRSYCAERHYSHITGIVNFGNLRLASVGLKTLLSIIWEEAV